MVLGRSYWRKPSLQHASLPRFVMLSHVLQLTPHTVAACCAFYGYCEGLLAETKRAARKPAQVRDVISRVAAPTSNRRCVLRLTPHTVAACCGSYGYWEGLLTETKRATRKPAQVRDVISRVAAHTTHRRCVLRLTPHTVAACCGSHHTPSLRVAAHTTHGRCVLRLTPHTVVACCGSHHTPSLRIAAHTTHRRCVLRLIPHTVAATRQIRRRACLWGPWSALLWRLCVHYLRSASRCGRWPWSYFELLVSFVVSVLHVPTLRAVHERGIRCSPTMCVRHGYELRHLLFCFPKLAGPPLGCALHVLRTSEELCC